MDFRSLLAGVGWLQYAAFDLLWLNGKDLRPLPLIRRKRRGSSSSSWATMRTSRILAVEERGSELCEAAQRLDLEGFMAKRKALFPTDGLVQAEGRGTVL